MLDDWFAHYGGKEFPFPEIAGRYDGKGLVVCADSVCIWDDLERLGARCDVGRGSVKAPHGWEFMIVNKLGETFPGHITHWYSNEGHLLQKFVDARRNEYRCEFGQPIETHSRRNAKWNWPFNGAGTSGLNAILVGLALGYDQLILCGMPLDDGPHNGEPHWRKTNFTNEASDQINGKPPRAWKRAMDNAFDGKVTSMSGRTREWLGSPSL